MYPSKASHITYKWSAFLAIQKDKCVTSIVVVGCEPFTIAFPLENVKTIFFARKYKTEGRKNIEEETEKKLFSFLRRFIDEFGDAQGKHIAHVTIRQTAFSKIVYTWIARHSISICKLSAFFWETHLPFRTKCHRLPSDGAKTKEAKWTRRRNVMNIYRSAKMSTTNCSTQYENIFSVSVAYMQKFLCSFYRILRYCESILSNLLPFHFKLHTIMMQIIHWQRCVSVLCRAN